jgi:hypothetical protein
VAISLTLYKQGNFFIDANIAYLGCALVCTVSLTWCSSHVLPQAHAVGSLFDALVASFLISTAVDLAEVLDPL